MFKLIIPAVMVVLIGTPDCAFADDNEALNEIYREFLKSKVDIEAVSANYADNVIHVGRKDSPFLAGKEEFLQTAFVPMAQLVNEGQMTYDATFYVVRRLISGNMANDVGYIHARVTMPGEDAQEQVQKFSWVFVKSGDKWQVVTDFDATLAPFSVLDSLEAQFTIE